MRLRNRLRKWWLCRRFGLRQHKVETLKVPHNGVLLVVPRCSRCGHVFAAHVQETVWNRDERRRWRKALPRAVRRAP